MTLIVKDREVEIRRGNLAGGERVTLFGKGVFTALVFLAVYFFSFWMVFSQIVPETAQWVAGCAALLSAAAAAFWVWRKIGTAKSNILQTTLQWAVIIGAVGFCGGFFGPIIFTPESNQGPLLGLFITGPLGFIAGGVLGFIYALCFKPTAAS